MMSDNLSGLFPNVSLGITPGLSLDSAQTFAVLTTILVLPTVWLKDLSLLSYLSGLLFPPESLCFSFFFYDVIERI